MKIIIHQTHHKIADFTQIFKDLKYAMEKGENGIHLFPELYLTGYPLQDLCLQKSFFTAYLNYLNELRDWASTNIDLSGKTFLVGGLDYHLTSEGNPQHIKNIILEFSAEKIGVPIYTKRLLPNYDIFDEKKYFTKGREPIVIEKEGEKFGLLICEDMWPSTFYDLDPVAELYEYCHKNKLVLNGILNLSASPFYVGKRQSRLNRAREISNLFRCPFFYVNRVGAEDEILFDGGSFAINGDNLLAQSAFFSSEIISAKTHDLAPVDYQTSKQHQSIHTWEELFKPALDLTACPPVLKEWDKDKCEEVFCALKFGFQEYAQKNGFKHFSVALSGGIDSALAITLINSSLQSGQTVEAIYMPSQYSSPLSYDLALALCERQGIPMKTMPIKFLHSTAKNLFAQTFDDVFEGLTDENIQSRLRGLLIYTRSNQINSMVVNTSNKSEIAVGYSTQYGDSVGAISLLGDLYKSQVFKLTEYINQKEGNLIPAGIIERSPSAELRPDQKDSDSLPDYPVLDALLESILSYRSNKADLEKFNFTTREIDQVLNLYRRSEYKRYQFCPILKISSKSFGFGYRIPLTKDSYFYTQS